MLLRLHRLPCTPASGPKPGGRAASKWVAFRRRLGAVERRRAFSQKSFVFNYLCTNEALDSMWYSGMYDRLFDAREIRRRGYLREQ